MRFSVNQRVRLTFAAQAYYAKAPIAPPEPGTVGTVVFIGFRPQDPKRPIVVQWDDPVSPLYSYREEDLMEATS